MKAKWLVAFLFIALNFTVVNGVRAQSLETISSSLQTGNAKEVSKYFDARVEITIVNASADYSKVQAEMVLKDFFAKNSPLSFNLIHKGTSNQGSQYGIGTLATSSGNYRTYVYIKQKGSGFLIQEIRFEKD